MGLSIKNAEVEAMARTLARRHGIGVTEAIRLALKERLDREAPQVCVWEKLQPLHEKLERMGRTGHSVDRAFYDELSGEP